MFHWPARHSSPIGSSSCCRWYGADDYAVSKSVWPFEALKDDKLQRSTELPKGAMAEVNVNVYVAMCLEGEKEAATHRCEYASTQTTDQP